MESPGSHAIAAPKYRWDGAVLWGALGLLMFAVLAFGATEAWSIFVVRAGAVMLLLVWAVGRAAGGGEQRIAVPHIFYPAALFMALVAAQWAGLSAYRYATMVEGMNYIAYGILMLLAVQCVHGEEDARRVVLAFAIFGGVLAFVSVMQGLSGSVKLLFLRTPRVAAVGYGYGPYVNHNHYAGMMEMVAPFLIVLAASDRPAGAQRAFTAFAALLAAGSIVLSRSRGGILAFALEAVFLAAFLLPASAGRRTRQIGALAAVVLLAFLLWLGGGPILERVGSIGDIAANQMRIDITGDSLRMFAQRPVLGWGVGTFPVVYPTQRSFFSDFFVNEAHNDYAQLLVEAGLAGFVAMLWYLVVLFRQGLPKITAPPLRSWSAIVTLAALTGVAGLLVHSFFDFNLHVPANAALFFFLGGIAAAEMRGENKQPARRPRESSARVN
ncbi:MAG: O-antigen ligase family protein [Candidatus Koribacter versatilis]|uniref:O-antigen ligase family protein n=1 Tax=Candidatus Korobacter versatilis TaxID=658062 RepID=A0A932A6L4_9BACT|nr:O-antigen ligase family protein [Candidatus Koribacter versatilis]